MNEMMFKIVNTARRTIAISQARGPVPDRRLQAAAAVHVRAVFVQAQDDAGRRKGAHR